MNRLGRAAMYTAITVAIVGGMSGCFLTDKETKDVAYGVSEPVSTLVIQGGTGDIRVVGGGSEVTVTEHQSYRDTEPAAVHRTEAGTLTLSYSCPDHNCAVGYEVHVPAGTVVKVKDDTGDLELTGLTAEVSAKTDTGNIRATALGSAVADLSSGTGDVRAVFAARPTRVQAGTDTGNVTLTVPNGQPYAVTAHTGTGNTKVDVAQQPGAAQSITAKSGTGDVRVTGV